MTRDWIIYVIAMAGILLGAWLWSSSAHSQSPPQPQCTPREALVDNLLRDYGEHPALAFVTASEQIVMEIFLNLETQTWTVTMTHSSGMTCPKSGGTGYSNGISDIPIGDPA